MNEVIPNQDSKLSSIKGETEEFAYFSSASQIVEKEIIRCARQHKIQRFDVEDLAQDTRLKLWRSAKEKLKSFAESELKVYVITAARNTFRNFIKKRIVENKHLDLSASESDFVSLDRIEGNTETELRSVAAAYWEFIKTLPLRQKFIFLFSEDDGGEEALYAFFNFGICSLEEIARQLNLSDESCAEIIDGLPYGVKHNKPLGTVFEKFYSMSMTEKQVYSYRNKTRIKLKEFAKKLVNSKK